MARPRVSFKADLDVLPFVPLCVVARSLRPTYDAPLFATALTQTCIAPNPSIWRSSLRSSETTVSMV